MYCTYIYVLILDIILYIFYTVHLLFILCIIYCHSTYNIIMYLNDSMIILKNKCKINHFNLSIYFIIF